MFLSNGFEAVGGVRLVGATVDRFLICDGGRFVARGDAAALDARLAWIQGSVFLSKHEQTAAPFIAIGGVDLTSATIGKSLSCKGGEFVSASNRLALEARNAKVDGGVFFRNGATADGKVLFAFASIGAGFQWRNVKSPEKAVLDLRFAKAGRLFNHLESWPRKGNLSIDGFVYNQIDGRALPNAEVQVRWLHCQPDTFLSQPYEQLAAVFRKRGLGEDALQVMIEKNKEQGRHLHTPSWNWRPWTWFDWVSWFFKWSWYRIFGNALVGYGYRPGRAFGWSLLVIVIGWLFFQLGYDWKLVTPTGDKAYVVEKDGNRRLKNGKPQLSEDYPKFNAFVYSVETFVPLLKLGIGEHWAPNANLGAPLNSGILAKIGFPKNYGSLLRCYMWVHIILGWVLGTLWIGGLTKLVKT